jgi:hypothetical protein
MPRGHTVTAPSARPSGLKVLNGWNRRRRGRIVSKMETLTRLDRARARFARTGRAVEDSCASAPARRCRGGCPPRRARAWPHSGTTRAHSAVHVDMGRHRFGIGAYRYFAHPLPSLVDALRRQCYAPLAVIANRWMESLGSSERFPARSRSSKTAAPAPGQRRPTPLLLRYEAGGTTACTRTSTAPSPSPCRWSSSSAVRAWISKAGEFLLVQQRPRAQSVAEVVPGAQGEMVVFANRYWPATGAADSIARTCDTASAAAVAERVSRSASSSTTRPDLDPHRLRGQARTPQASDDGTHLFRIAGGEHARSRLPSPPSRVGLVRGDARCAGRWRARCPRGSPPAPARAAAGHRRTRSACTPGRPCPPPRPRSGRVSSWRAESEDVPVEMALFDEIGQSGAGLRNDLDAVRRGARSSRANRSERSVPEVAITPTRRTRVWATAVLTAGSRPTTGIESAARRSSRAAPEPCCTRPPGAFAPDSWM